MIVYTVGTFDLLHVGHLALLEYCATLGAVLAVGVASDRVVNSYKPNVPVIPLDQRVEMLEALRCVVTAKNTAVSSVGVTHEPYQSSGIIIRHSAVWFSLQVCAIRCKAMETVGQQNGHYRGKWSTPWARHGCG